MRLLNTRPSKLGLFRILLGSILALSLTACEKNEEDNQNPKIIVIQPEDGNAFKLGDDFLVVTVMHDYVALDRYRYTVSWFDDPSNVSPNPSDPALSIDQTAPIITSDSAPHWEDVNFSISLPLGIRRGYYMLDIYCFDKAGNSYKRSLKLLFQE